MFHKTTSYIFHKYGEIINEISNKANIHSSSSILKIKEKKITNFYRYNAEVYVRVISGIVLLVVTTDPNQESYEEFVIHRTIKIGSNVQFNFISISSQAKVELFFEKGCKKTIIPYQQAQPILYEPIAPSFSIKEIYGYYYQVRNQNYHFEGEKHNYWELTFIDHGSLSTNVDNEMYMLKELDLILYAPNQFHTQSNDSNQPCSSLTILFEMDFVDDYLLTNRVYHAHRDIHKALQNFIKVSNNTMMYEHELMLCYLKELIIRILQYDFLSSSPVASSPMQQKFENELLNEVLIYINDHIYDQLTIEEICLKFSISRSSLQTLFKNNLNIAPKHYISNLKLTKSKILIKESVYTISEISAMLGFTSIHYFSRKFKQEFGITPSDYSKTIYN